MNYISGGHFKNSVPTLGYHYLNPIQWNYIFDYPEKEMKGLLSDIYLVMRYLERGPLTPEIVSYL